MRAKGARSKMPSDECMCLFGDASVALFILSPARYLREFLSELFVADGAFCLVGSSDDGAEAISVVTGHDDAIILVDAGMPGGGSAAAELRDAGLTARLVVIGIAETIDEVIIWAEAGAIGYLSRQIGLGELVSGLKGIAAGEQVCAPHIASGLLNRIATGGQPAPDQPSVKSMLTERELQIARLIAKGMCNKDVARTLKVGVSTVKSHVHNLLAKSQLQRRAQLAEWLCRYEGPESSRI